jgi:hypothetical protein
MSTRKAGRRKGRAATRGLQGAVAPRENEGNGRRKRRRSLQNTNGTRERPLQEVIWKRAAAMSAAVAESGRPPQAAVAGTGRYRRPLQEAGGGRDGGRHINNALRQDVSTAYINISVT